jgi:nucleotide-binding universal stress UspA family protein
MLTYVAGFDGTEASRAADRFAAELGSRTGAEVIAAHVYSPLPVGHPYAVVPALGEEERKRRADAERLVEALDEEGIERRAVPASSPAHGLQNLVEQENAALVAVGTTHHGALGRLVPGGEAERLLHGSPCPVAVVPAGAELGDVRAIAVAYDGGGEANAALATAEALARRLGARLLLLAAVDPSAFGRGISESRPELEATAQEQLGGC